MEIKAKSQCLENRAKGRPYVFTARIQMDNETRTRDYKCCYCSEKDYKKLAKNLNFNDTIFLYFFSHNDIVDAADGKNGFKLLDIVLSGFKYV